MDDKNNNIIKECKNCSYWKRRTDSAMGLCYLSKHGSSMMRSGCGLITSETFGCKLFEPKIYKQNKINFKK